MSAPVDQPARERDRPSSTWRRGGSLALLLVVVAASGGFAYAELFSQFRFHDDEGFFLVALRAYQEGRGLYERIDTVYGPFYFQSVAGLFSLLRIPLDNVGARWVALCVWIVACLAAYRYVRHVTGSAAAGLLAYVLSFPILAPLSNDPLHPGGLIVLLLSAIVLLSSGLESPTRRRATLAACGALTAALVLTKLNVGVFVLIAFATFFLRGAPESPAGRAARFGAALLLPAIPFCLMARQLGLEGFRDFAFLISLSLLPLGFLPRLDSRESLPRRLLPYAAGGSATALLVLVICLFGGTSLSGIWNSLILGSLRFVGKYIQEPVWDVWSDSMFALAVVPLVLGAALQWTTWIGPRSRVVLKLAGGLLLLTLCLTLPKNPMLGLPLVWLVAVPGSSSRDGLATRTLLASLVPLQALHVYPIAGNPIAYFSFLLPVVGVITVWDAFGELPMSWRETCGQPRWKIAGGTAVVLIFAGCHSTIPILRLPWQRYAAGVPLALRGAESIRLPEQGAATLRWVTSNLELNADTFVGLPGVHSFYGWSALRPPVPYYPHTWIIFHDDVAQENILRSLLAAKRPCIVRNRDLIAFWTQRRPMRPGPLPRAAEKDFRVAAAAGGYELLFPLLSRPDLVLSAFPMKAPQKLLDRHRAQDAFRLAFPAMKGVRVARITVRDTGSGMDLFDSADRSPERRLSILNSSGTDLLQGNPSGLIDLSQRLDVTMLCPTKTMMVASHKKVVRAFDERGRIVARLLLTVEPRPR